MTQHILITGATSGIGYQLALDYLKQGHVVYAVGRRTNILQTLADIGATVFEIDLTDREQVRANIQKIDKLDMVISCAGTCHYIDLKEEQESVRNSDNNNEQPLSKNKINFNAEEILNVMDINYGTLVNTIEAVLPLLVESKGRLVAIGSASAYVPFPRAEAYGSSKSAVHYLMKTLLISLKPYGIDVNLVVPGFVDTPMTAKNDFSMPFLQTTQQASQAIREGIEQNKAVIEFPKHLTIPLKTLGVLPDILWSKVSKKLYGG